MGIDERVYTIQGWMSDVELRWLYNMANNIPDGSIIIETGIWKGRSSAALYLGAGETKSVISIDCWLVYDNMPVDFIEEIKNGLVLPAFKANMEMLGINIKPYKEEQTGAQYMIEDSVIASNYFPDKSVDIVFIDDDHHRCGEVIDAWLPKIKRNGAIAGHDYFRFYNWIQQEIHKRFWIHKVVDNIWIRGVSTETWPDWLN